jgi:hypothetical protein
LETLLAIADIQHIDILKIDIESAELELFKSRSEYWLDRVDMIIIETHDRFRPGSETAVRDALKEKFEKTPTRVFLISTPPMFSRAISII